MYIQVATISGVRDFVANQMKTVIARHLLIEIVRIELKKNFDRDQVLILGKNREADAQTRSQSTWHFYSVNVSKYFA